MAFYFESIKRDTTQRKKSRKMGGNAIKNTRRLDRSEYESYEIELKKHLTEFLHTPFNPLLYYHSKESFGDIDFVVAQPKPSRAELQHFFDKIGSQEQFFNGDMLSFEYKNFQVDLNFVAAEDFEAAQFYFAYNDLNNLVGRVAHKFGLKFGFDGLTYPIRTESGYRAKKIVLSKDPASIYAFLGYDYERYLKGFETREDIFEFVTSSPYFSAEIFELEALNHINRTRNKKRQTYSLFLQWLEGKCFKNFDFAPDKSLYLIRIHNHFFEKGVNLLQELALYAEENRKHEFVKKTFNGQHLIANYGIKGADLGQVMAAFKNDFCQKTGQTDFEEAVYTSYAALKAPDKQMAAVFDDWYKDYTETNFKPNS
jgi:hypothetical protein